MVVAGWEGAEKTGYWSHRKVIDALCSPFACAVMMRWSCCVSSSAPSRAEPRRAEPSRAQPWARRSQRCLQSLRRTYLSTVSHCWGWESLLHLSASHLVKLVLGGSRETCSRLAEQRAAAGWLGGSVGDWLLKGHRELTSGGEILSCCLFFVSFKY